jgi:hypothetical protein
VTRPKIFGFWKREGRRGFVPFFLGQWEFGKSVDAMQGLAETKLLKLAEENGNFEAVVVKCGYVLKKESSVPEVLVEASRNVIRVDELAAAMVELAVMGSRSQTIGNAELRSMGKKLLKERKEKDK